MYEAEPQILSNKNIHQGVAKFHYRSDLLTLVFFVSAYMILNEAIDNKDLFSRGIAETNRSS